MESLGKHLKILRAARSLTQTEAAQRIGIEQSYLSKLESEQAWASLEILKRVCRVYKIDLKALWPSNYGLNQPTHTVISLKVEDVDAQDTLNMIAEFGGISYIGTELINARIDLELEKTPWDIALAQVAAQLGYRIEITGSLVEFIPIKQLK